MTATMKAVRLHGIRDVRVDTVPIPEPGPGELLVRIEACGVCPTDARKYDIGVNDGSYPFNPGHEWVGRVAALGAAAGGWSVGDRVYGDTYAGYAEYATIATAPAGWSRGALAVGELAPERAVFVEPLADCLHCVLDQGQVTAASRVAVLGMGSMGVQIAAVAARAGAEVLAIEPREERRALALRFGAAAAAAPAEWEATAQARWGALADVVIVTVARAAAAAEAIRLCAPGGRVVLFAGFGDEGVAPVDLNRIHYQEIAVVGSEWVGTPPHQRLEHYDGARELLASGTLALEELVSDRIGLDGVEDALRSVREQRTFKAVLVP